MKKKVLAIALAVALIAIMVGGSLAYFTAEDEATNTFTIGSVEIDLWENGVEAGETMAMGQLIPVVGSDPTKETDNYQLKAVQVKNTGLNPAYVEVFVAVPKVLDDAGVLKLMDNYPDSESYGWEAAINVGEMTQGTIAYNVYKYRYSTALSAGVITDEAIEYVYINSQADMDVTRDENGTITAAYFTIDGNQVDFNVATMKLDVHVAAWAIQSEGFDTAESALSTFGKAHPWAN